MWRGGIVVTTILRFHTPLIEPCRRISRTRLSDKAAFIRIIPHRCARRLVHGGPVIASGASQPVVELIGFRQSPGCPPLPLWALN